MGNRKKQPLCSHLTLLLCAALGLTIPGNSAGQGVPSVKATVSARSISTAGSLTLVVEATALEDHGLFPLVPSGTLGDFTILRSSTGPQRLDSGPPTSLHQKLTFLLAPGLPGEHLIPPITIFTAGNKLNTEPITIEVTSVLPPETDGLEPRPLEPAVSTLRPSTVVLVLVLLAVAATIAVFLACRRKARLKASAGEPGDADPSRAAARDLASLPSGATAEEIHAIATRYLTATLGPHADALTTGDAAGQPALEAYLRCFDKTRFSAPSPPEGDDSDEGISERPDPEPLTRELRSALEQLIDKGGAP